LTTTSRPLHFIRANWPAPRHIHALTTTRIGGHSQQDFDALNLAMHVGDHAEHVQANRAQLRTSLNLPSEPWWLNQTHSIRVVNARGNSDEQEADASITQDVGQVLAVLTADCVPIVLCSASSPEIAAIHAGWRGLCNGIIEATLNTLSTPNSDLMAWIGPCISAPVFEVGSEVRQAFIAHHPVADLAFTPTVHGRFTADLVQLTKQRLAQQGVSAVYGGEHCTHQNPEQFYSYRRDGQTGRIATLIWAEC
jgi:YfiH family protein